MRSSDVLKVFRVVMLVFCSKKGQLMWLVHLVQMHPGWLPRGISKWAETSGSPPPILGLYSPSVYGTCPLSSWSLIGHQDGRIMAFSTRMKMSKWRVHECLHVLTHPFTKSVKQIQQARGTNSPSSLELWHLTEYFEVLVDCTNPEILLCSNSKTSNLMPFSPSWLSCDAQSQSGCTLSLLHWHNHRLIPLKYFKGCRGGNQDSLWVKNIAPHSHH